ncbi:UNVERIFIED_CONTAM: ER membrane protein complex subunit [Sesamum calycinum]|uniref:ER membrane protein complex subunit 4 n=1 Tax=Sesamum calycinum TaxID=2727403 RepID=A0AAW2QWR7_9LAMI
MDKGKAVMGSGRRWAVEFTDNSTSHSSRDIPDPPGFTRASQEQDDSALSKQKKDAEDLINPHFICSCVVFEPYKDNKVDLLAPKLVFIALNLVGLGLGIWKLNTLGLLPTHVSDWVSSLPPPQEVEYSGGGIPLQ